jgi:predicted transcriptional regulator
VDSDRVRPMHVRPQPRTYSRMGPSQRRILEALGVGAATTRTLAARTGLSAEAVKLALARLEARGLVAPTGIIRPGGALVWRRIEGDAFTELRKLEAVL